MIALIALAGTAAVSPAALRPDGLGGVKTGMTLKQAERALGRPLRHRDPVDADTEACSYVFASTGGLTAQYMIEHGRVTRIDVTNRIIRTAKGVGIGTSVAALRRAYPRALTSHSDIYTDEPDFEISARDGKHAIVFETEKGVVKRMHGGQFPAVRYIEGCQ